MARRVSVFQSLLKILQLHEARRCASTAARLGLLRLGGRRTAAVQLIEHSTDDTNVLQRRHLGHLRSQMAVQSFRQVRATQKP